MSWNPETAPEPARWLDLDEDEQVRQIEQWHEANPTPALHPDDADLGLHSRLHAIVERQIAAGDPPVVGETLARLQADGLRRHPALHAIARVLVEHLHAAVVARRPFDVNGYDEALSRLRPEDAVVIEGLARMTAADDPGRPLNRAERRRRKKRP